MGYTASEQQFGLKDLIVHKSPMGLEFYPRDRKAVIRTRMDDLRRTTPEKRIRILEEVINQAAAKVNVDFGSSSVAVGGIRIRVVFRRVQSRQD